MKIVHLPGFASIFAIATGLCKLPPTETSISDTIGTFEPAPPDGGVIYHVCKPNYYSTIGSYYGGSLVALENSVKYCCNNSTGNFQTKDNTTIVLTTVACVEFSQDGKCGFTTNGTVYIVYDKEVKCPAGKIVILLDNGVVNLIGLPEVECVSAPTTSTSTTASTSTSTRTVSTTTVAAMPGCAFLPVPTNLPWTKLEFNRTYLPGGRVQISCDKRVVGNFGEIRGNVTAELTSSYTCDPAIGKWISETGVQTALKTMACTDNYAVFADMYGTYPYKATFKQTDENGSSLGFIGQYR
ncbi:hypothetical protein PRIPAC_89097 [Pristionchus pacificus]|uniref:Uncharacterized protein n=1 Tax=Pristionchus pacificus TaxID=54126 RepID=A0A2A6B9G5_PRIPA|nr:hypothetical protein PRIPAC_89097 [Pristionchus pacificus]|eukprot:PDM62519.1 hypothetical protein PRIPAC_51961 [Pristionchus pacificus]